MPALDNARHEEFCRLYRQSFNATEAATGAGYSAKTSRSQGSRLLTHVDIQARLRELEAEARDRHEVTEADVIEELRRIAFLDLRALLTWDEEAARFVPSADLPPEVAAAVQHVKARTTTRQAGEAAETEVTLDVKAYDKLAALDKLAKYLGLFTERVDLTSKGGRIGDRRSIYANLSPPPPR